MKMIKVKLILLVLIILVTPTYAADSRPSEKSIRELLRVTEAHKTCDNMMVQIDALMKSSMQQALNGETITPKEQKQMDDMQNKMIAMFKQEISGETMEPLYLKVYRDSFTQQEVDGMLSFYVSPSGQAVIHKMPLVIQNTMSEVQKRMGPFLQKLKEMEKETIEKLKADTAQ